MHRRPRRLTLRNSASVRLPGLAVSCRQHRRLVLKYMGIAQGCLHTLSSASKKAENRWNRGARAFLFSLRQPALSLWACLPSHSLECIADCCVPYSTHGPIRATCMMHAHCRTLAVSRKAAALACGSCDGKASTEHKSNCNMCFNELCIYVCALCT